MLSGHPKNTYSGQRTPVRAPGITEELVAVDTADGTVLWRTTVVDDGYGNRFHHLLSQTTPST